MTDHGHRSDLSMVGIAAGALAALLVALLAAGPARADFSRRSAAAVSPAIFPPQNITVRFSHKKHIAMDLACSDCHVNISTSGAAADRNLPAERTCAGADCHAIDRPSNPTPGKGVASGACVTCHAGYDPARPEEVSRIVLPTPNLKFSHKVHAQKQVRCSACHGDVSKIDVATRQQLPRMTTCLGCHDNRKAPAACTTCHLKLPDGRLRTEFPDGQLAPTGQIYGDDHDLTFKTEHARVAQGRQQYCESCHKKSFCSSCHAGDVKPNGLSLHSNDYLSIHSVDARKNNPTCDSCHKRQTFCVGCHQRSGVGFDRPGAFAGGANADDPEPAFSFHPEGWADQRRRGPNHHAWQAMRNLKTCASCHRETFCTNCHATKARTGDKTISPHPRDWANSGFCKALASRNKRMCVRCHDPFDGNGLAVPEAMRELDCQKPE